MTSDSVVVWQKAFEKRKKEKQEKNNGVENTNLKERMDIHFLNFESYKKAEHNRKSVEPHKLPHLPGEINPAGNLETKENDNLPGADTGLCWDLLTRSQHSGEAAQTLNVGDAWLKRTIQSSLVKSAIRTSPWAANAVHF